MRILIYDHMQRELESARAFNMALVRAFDPRLILHRPRDPEKTRLMAELGIETTIAETPPKIAERIKQSQKPCKKSAVPDSDLFEGMQG